jgi:hypothetical protein
VRKLEVHTVNYQDRLDEPSNCTLESREQLRYLPLARPTVTLPVLNLKYWTKHGTSTLQALVLWYGIRAMALAESRPPRVPGFFLLSCLLLAMRCYV